MDLAEYIDVVWRHKIAVVLTIVVTTVLALVGTLTMTPTYRATAKLHVSTTTNGSTDWVDLDLKYADRLMNTYAQMAVSDPVRAELAASLSLVTQLPDIDVDVIPDTELMKITVEGDDPETVANTANELANILISLSADLSGQAGNRMRTVLEEEILVVEGELNEARAEFARRWGGEGADVDEISSARSVVDLKQRSYESLLNLYEQTRVRDVILANSLSVVDPADVPRAPFRPDVVLNLVLGFLVGAIGGVGLAFLLENMEKSLAARSQQSDRSPARPVAMPVMHETLSSHANGRNLDAGAANWSQLHAVLRKVVEKRSLHTLLVTSTGPADDNTTPLLDAAKSIVGEGHRVVVVDCLPGYSAFQEALEGADVRGFGDVLQGTCTVDEVVRTTAMPGLGLIPLGEPAPAQFLDSSVVATVLGQLAERYDLVVMSTPAFFSTATAASLATEVDGVVVVVGGEQNSTQVAGLIMKQLAGIGANLVATVVIRRNEDASSAWPAGTESMYDGL